ncbi:AAA family ATPase [Lysinibacillus capsici]|uniref:AAA family ATPase n=1 Tax=Lysinibacillus capsici TaxID=2115968 RepID=UPI0036C48480
MDNYGFYLSTLSLRGKGKKNAEITFYQGLNLISGASNTGKTFIFQCIDFIFGGRDVPKNIDERKGYDIVLLELRTYDGRILTLRRNLTDKKMYVYECEINEIDNIVPVEIKNQHDKEDPGNVSTILLDICKAPYKNVVKNKQGITVSFSFRDFVHISMLSEKRIIDSISPIYPEDSMYTNTKSQSAFRTIMTGKDDTFYSENKQKNDVKLGAKAKLEIVENMILDTRISIEEISRELEGENFNIDDFEREITSLKNQITDKSSTLDTLQMERNSKWMNLQNIKSEKMLLSESVKRFKLLRKNYESDLERLDFIEEAIFFTEQLVDIKCPVCDNPFKPEEVDVKNGVLAEFKKTRMQLGDLISTILETQEKEHIMSSEINIIKLELQTIDQIIEEELQPMLYEFKNKIENVMNLRDKFKMIEFNKEKLKELIKNQEELTDQIKAKKAKVEFSNDVNQNSLKLFSQIVQDILIDWQLEEVVNVEFDEVKKDIIINGKDKEGFGKGYASILNSAFVVGVLKYAIKLGLPHPKIIILDSPLTTYKEKDVKEDTNDQKVKEEVKNAFFESLNKYQEKVQFIILENIEPKKEIQKKINYYRFTRNESIGRYGFIPVNS